MNTKLAMGGSAIILAGFGLILTFAPELVWGGFGLESQPMALLAGQVMGGLYFAAGMLNWMAKNSLVGGIYNRPIVLGNLVHYLVAGLAIGKALLANPDLPMVIWIAALVYLALGLTFSVMLVSHPAKDLS